jgi:PAS domain S-box-containing protein
MKIRTKLVCAFLALLLPLGATSLLSVHLFTNEMKREAESELADLVNLLYRLCSEAQRIGEHAEPAVNKSLQDMVASAIRGSHVGKTGYAYVMNPQGTLLVHPAQEGKNIYGEVDSDGVAFIQEICKSAVRLGEGEMGEIRYPWMNPELGDERPQMKVLKYVYFQPWDWVIAAGSYESEIFKVARRIRHLVILILGITLILLLVQDVFLGQALTRPIHALSAVTQKMAEGDLEQLVPVRRGDEIGDLAKDFNRMAEKLKSYTKDLERTVRERSLELAESERNYRTFVESSLDGLVTTDEKGYITFVNRGMEVILNENRKSLVGRHIATFYERGITEAREIMAELREKGSFYNREVWLVSRDRRIPILTSASLLYDEEGRMAGTLGAFKDVTERKTLQLKLRQTEAQLFETAKMRALGELVAGVAHSINNPLMASNTMLHVIREDLQRNNVKALKENRLTILMECNRRIEAIVKHLKDFSRQSEGQFAVTDVNKTIENALLISGQHLLNRNIRIKKTLSPALPPVWGDTNQLEEVIMELVANARDAMEEQSGEKNLTLSTSAHSSNGKTSVVVEIEDTGKGIPEEIRGKIFEPFFSTKEKGKGTGLGLSICYGIIEEHGGRMDVDSVPGDRTVFRIILPAMDDRESAEKPDAPSRKAEGTPAPNGGRP